MCRTYWKKNSDESWEFLGAYSDGHTVKDKLSPQAVGAIIDVQDLNPNDFNASLEGFEYKIVNVPQKYGRMLKTKVPIRTDIETVKGLLKKA